MRARSLGLIAFSVAVCVTVYLSTSNYVGRADLETYPRTSDAGSREAPQASDPEPAADVFTHEPATTATTPSASTPDRSPGELREGGLVSFLELADGEAFQPTAHGLWMRTSDLWAQEEFLNLTPERMRALLPLDDTLATLPPSMSLLELIGSDLPTVVDCERAVADPASQALLESLCALDATVAELQRVPSSRRSKAFLWRLEALRRQRDSAEDALAERMDQVSGYRRWAILTRLYREWAR